MPKKCWAISSFCARLTSAIAQKNSSVCIDDFLVIAKSNSIEYCCKIASKVSAILAAILQAESIGNTLKVSPILRLWSYDHMALYKCVYYYYYINNPGYDIDLLQTDICEVCPNPLVLSQQLTHIELERLSMIGPEEFIQAFAVEKKLGVSWSCLT